MKFGYFTLSDNRYKGNTRKPETFIQEIFQQSLHAETVGLNSAWIGEHHFNLLGVNSAPQILLAQLAGATKRIRLAPAVVVLPIHHPLHVAAQWATLDLLSGGRVDFAAGRGYDQHEYAPFQADFHNSAEVFAEGMQIVWRAWTEPGKFSHQGKYYQFDNIEVRPKPVQSPLRPYVACFSRISMDLAAKNGWNIIFAPFAASMVYGSLANGAQEYRDTCAKYGQKPGRIMCSYFTHIGNTPAEEDYGREVLLRYFKECIIDAFPSDPKTVPPTLKYFLNIVDILKNMKKENLTSKSIIVGSPQKVVDELKEVEAAGIDEVILYFNYGMKPHTMVMDLMDQFAGQVMPAFDGAKAAAD
jgi:alkanesulfonate monooxygenase SsuD/methylene tetrahydromethanopterin reductase-like flavin-dependent oxidoreductase (luciferase family)